MSQDEVRIGALAPLVGYHLRRASGAFLVDFTAAMHGNGLRQVTFAVIAVVAANPGINQGMVGRALSIKRANMVALITELIDKGLIDRAIDRSDRRAFSLSLTPAGQAALADATRRIALHERRMLADLSQGERATLLELLGRVARRGPPADSDEAPAA